MNQVIEKEKAKNLSGTQGDSAPLKETAPGWNENLAVSFQQCDWDRSDIIDRL
jgi:hypothetical protein